ncbi:hypothetical protein GCM10027168_71260 [Streptomyces capparidis]
MSLTRRLIQLYAGLVLYGVSVALQVRAALGLDPWDVFHQGLAERTGLSIGVVMTLVGAAVLLLWIPLRQRPGLGTVSNILVIGAVMDATLHLTPEPERLAVRIPLLALAVVLNGVAIGLYIGADFGPGARDGLMTGLHRRTGRSLRLVRTGIELTVLTAGYLLGGSVGVGTVLYALTIGPLAQYFLKLFGGARRTTPGDGSGPDADGVVASGGGSTGGVDGVVVPGGGSTGEADGVVVPGGGPAGEADGVVVPESGSTGGVDGVVAPGPEAGAGSERDGGAAPRAGGSAVSGSGAGAASGRGGGVGSGAAPGRSPEAGAASTPGRAPGRVGATAPEEDAIPGPAQAEPAGPAAAVSAVGAVGADPA